MILMWAAAHSCHLQKHLHYIIPLLQTACNTDLSDCSVIPAPAAAAAPDAVVSGQLARELPVQCSPTQWSTVWTCCCRMMTSSFRRCYQTRGVSEIEQRAQVEWCSTMVRVRQSGVTRHNSSHLIRVSQWSETIVYCMNFDLDFRWTVRWCQSYN